MTNKSLGTQHFVAQRLTAIVNLLVGIPAFIIFLMIYDDGYSEIRELISQEIVWIPMVIYIISLSYHMKIGVGHMLDDYFDGGLKLFLGIGLFLTETEISFLFKAILNKLSGPLYKVFFFIKSKITFFKFFFLIP